MSATSRAQFTVGVNFVTNFCSSEIDFNTHRLNTSFALVPRTRAIDITSFKAFTTSVFLRAEESIDVTGELALPRVCAEIEGIFQHMKGNGFFEGKPKELHSARVNLENMCYRVRSEQEQLPDDVQVRCLKCLDKALESLPGGNVTQRAAPTWDSEGETSPVEQAPAVKAAPQEKAVSAERPHRRKHRKPLATTSPVQQPASPASAAAPAVKRKGITAERKAVILQKLEGPTLTDAQSLRQYGKTKSEAIAYFKGLPIEDLSDSE